jgi:hypothetical protein
LFDSGKFCNAILKGFRRGSTGKAEKENDGKFAYKLLG